MNKKILALGILPVTLAAVGVIGLVGMTSVYAEDSTDYPTIVQNLAEKFGLSESDVQSVFEETRTQEKEERLDELVDDGTITEAQKQLILDKEEEQQTKMEEIMDQSMTASERRDAMDALRDEMDTWADENDIPQEALRLCFGPGGGMGEGRGMMGGPGMGM